MPCHSFTILSQWWNLHFGSPLTLKLCFLNSGGIVKLMHACLCVRRNIKSSFHHCGSPAKLVHFFSWLLKRNAQAWWKLLSRIFLALNMSCHSFTRPPQWWTQLFGSLSTLTMVCTRKSTMVENIFYSDTQTGIHELHETSRHSFTSPPQWWKLLHGFLWALKLAWARFAGPP